MPAGYHGWLEIISTGLILVWPERLYTHVFIATEASYVQLPVGFSHNQ